MNGVGPEGRATTHVNAKINIPAKGGRRKREESDSAEESLINHGDHCFWCQLAEVKILPLSLPFRLKKASVERRNMWVGRENSSLICSKTRGLGVSSVFGFGGDAQRRETLGILSLCCPLWEEKLRWDFPQLDTHFQGENFLPWSCSFLLSFPTFDSREVGFMWKILCSRRKKGFTKKIVKKIITKISLGEKKCFFHGRKNIFR